MPVFDQEIVKRLKQIIKWHPRGITISDLAMKMEMNRNLLAKYLDILLISGQVDMQVIGTAKVYFLSHRVPISSILEFSSDLVIILDSQQQIVQVNEPVLQLLNQKKETLIGTHIRETGNPFLGAIPVTIFPDNSDTVPEQASRMECILQEKKFYFKVKQLPTVFEDGAHGITIIIEDITDQIEYQKVLELNEAKYRGIVEDQTEFITRFLSDGTLIFINDAYARYLGKDKEQLLRGNHIPDIKSEDIAYVRKCIQSLDTETPVVTFECRTHHCSGHERWNLWTVRALFDDKRKPIEYQGVGRDNTEKREAATRINQYVRDLEFLSRKAQEFVESSPDADIFQVIARGLAELLPNAVIGVNSYDPLSDTITVRSFFSDTDRQVLSTCLGREYVGFQYRLNSVPASLRTLALNTIRDGKLFQTDESLYNFFFQQIPENICDHIKETLNLGDRYYGIGLIRHGILFGVVTFSLRKGETLPNSPLIETYIRQASIVLHRRYTEDALKASETKYRGIVEDQIEFVTRFLPDGTLTYANNSLCRFFLMDRAELLERSIFSLSRIPKDDQDSLRIHLLSMDFRNPVRSIEHRVIDPSGKIHWIQWTNRALLDDNGTIIEYQGVGRDITDQKEAEAKIRQYITDIEFLSQKSFEFLELPTDADIYGTICRGVKTILPNAIIIINSIDPVTNVATTRCVLGDEERNVFSTFIGKEVIGTNVKLPEPGELQTERMAVLSRNLTKVPGNLFITMHKSVPEEICAKIEEALNTGDIYAIGLVSQGIILASMVIMLRKGEIITHDGLIKTYMTHASIALLRYRTEKTLKKNEKLYRSVIENIQDVFYRSDKEGNLIMASPSWAHLLGYDSLDDCIGYNIAEKFYFEPQKRKEFLDAVLRDGSVHDYDVILKRKDGRPVHVSTNSHPYYDNAGNLLGIEGIFRDMSERYAAAKKMHEQLEHMDFFSRKLQDFIELSPESDIFQAIGTGFQEILPGSVITVNSFDPGSKTFRVRALFSESDHEIIKKIMGQEGIGMIVPFIDEELANELMSGKVYPLPKNHFEILFRHLAPDTFNRIENSLSTANIYSVGLIWQDMLLGTITFALKSGVTLTNSSLIETFARAASIVLHRKSADDALKESEEIFSSVAQYAPLPIAIIAPDGTYRYINKKFTETFGYDLNDFRTGKEWFSLAYPDPVYRKKVIDAWNSDLETYKSGVERPRRFTVRCKNGVDREIVFRPVTLANKKQFVIYEEIPEEQNSENLQKLLSRIVEATSDAIIGEKTDGIILQWNDGATHLFGYTGEEALGQNISLIIPQDQQEENHSLRNRIINGETVKNHKTRRMRKDGRIIDVEVTLSPLTDENGIITGQSTIARKICFENLKEQQKESVEHHEILVENRIGEGYPDAGKGGAGVPVIKTTGIGYPVHLFNALKMARDYIAIIDRSGKCVWANDAFAGVVNAASGNDLEGKSIALYIAPEFRKIALDSLIEIKKSGYKTVQLMILSSSGRVPVEANISAINTDEGNLLGYMAIARTIEKNKNRKT